MFLTLLISFHRSVWNVSMILVCQRTCSLSFSMIPKGLLITNNCSCSWNSGPCLWGGYVLLRVWDQKMLLVPIAWRLANLWKIAAYYYSVQDWHYSEKYKISYVQEFDSVVCLTWLHLNFCCSFHFANREEWATSTITPFLLEPAASVASK